MTFQASRRPGVYALNPDDPAPSLADTVRNAFDPYGIAEAGWNWQRAWWTNPAYAAAQSSKLTTEAVRLGTYAASRWLGQPASPPQEPVIYDDRFADAAWSASPWFDGMKEAYLAWSRWLMDATGEAPSTDTAAHRRMMFWMRQIVDALSPTNTPWTNPQVLHQALNTGGRSLADGLKMLLEDMSSGEVRMTDPNAFQVGLDLATTPGRVVLRTPLFELIQYAPRTATVYGRPILFVPPWINKYYILDLNPRKSLIAHLIDAGHTVFTISWKNPDESMRGTSYDDYLTQGLQPALDAVRTITGSPKVLPVGYCIGGTLLSTYMAWMNRAATAKRNLPIEHWTAFTTMVDFEDPGDIGVFVNRRMLAEIDRIMERDGFLDGGKMAFSFRMLRPNNLIWQYCVSTYLLGEQPPAFDVLFWNSDNTRMPQAMHGWYLREFYLHNRLRERDSLCIAGHPIDLGRITQPLYNVAAEQDHIAPWRQAFRLSGLVGGPARSVLATSGHIFGIINPPVDPPKRRYWVAEGSGTVNVERYREDTPKRPGSWWEDWTAWLAERSGDRVAPPPMGGPNHPPLDEAPGTYVLEP